MLVATDVVRTKPSKNAVVKFAMQNPLAVARELNNRSLYHFIEYFWPVVSAHDFQGNWHIEDVLCPELETLAKRVAKKQPKKHDLVVNVPPGTTKTITCSIMFPAWCWTRWPWMRFICASYSEKLAMESAEYCRDLIRSELFQQMYPDINIKPDKDTKSNFKIVTRDPDSFPGHKPRMLVGGSRFSTSVGGTLMGFHGDILIVDDPLNPTQAVSDVQLKTANDWCERTLPTRKTSKTNTPILYIMQRLHQDDPSGHLLDKKKSNVRHICLPGEIIHFKDKVRPVELILKYDKEGLLDPVRLPWSALKDLEADLGQYGYAGQIGQDPTPPGGGMFKVNRYLIILELPHHSERIKTVRYWDKAGSADSGAYSVGVKMTSLLKGRWVIEDVVRGQWSTEVRERMIRRTAEADGDRVEVWVEQEPGSGGKDSASGTIRNLAGFVVHTERPTGDKLHRADSYSVQVNDGAFMLLKGEWNHAFIEEHRFFPYSTYKDQVDAASGAFNKLVGKKFAKIY